MAERKKPSRSSHHPHAEQAVLSREVASGPGEKGAPLLPAVATDPQGVNEDLHASNEVLQALNEELTATNTRLEEKVAALSRAHDDLANLLASTDVGTLFLDDQLRIQRFTPMVNKVLNLIPSDVGQPMSHMAQNIGGADLLTDCRDVLHDAQPREHEVQISKGEWCVLRVLPYRTLDDKVGGVVVTFTDVTRLKAAQYELRELNATLERRVAERTGKLRKYQQHLQSLASQVATAEQNERRRLAEGLHDNVQQLLAAAKAGLTSLQDVRGEYSERAGRVAQWIGEALQATRTLIFELSPSVLYQEGLVAALAHLAEQCKQKHGLTTSIHQVGEIDPLPEALRVLLYQAVRELLFNVVKHAGTDKAEVALRRSHGELFIQVKDHGRGGSEEKSKHREIGGFGLANVRERLLAFGGELKRETSTGNGMIVTVRVPLNDSVTPSEG